MKRIEDNVREPLLIVLAAADEPLSIDALKRRVQRSRLSRRLVQATASELQRGGFIELIGPDQRYKLSNDGQRWTAARYEVACAGDSRSFAPRPDSADLPNASDEYRKEVRREAWLSIAVSLVPLLLFAVLIAILR